ncbi:MAG: hypothetical protein QM817_21195 [Archangium sp.]
MLTLLILASCANGVAELEPPANSIVPVNPVLFVFDVPATDLRIEDASGTELPFLVSPLANSLEKITVQAADGVSFFVLLPKTQTTSRVPARQGPWRVMATAPIDRSAPTIEPEEEYAYDGCTSSDGWSLTSDRSAPVWEFEVTANDTIQTSTYNSSLMVGSWGCGRSSYRWDAADTASVRVRGLFSDGSVGAWSNVIELDKPRIPLLVRVLRASAKAVGGPLELFGLVFVVLAIAGGVVVARRTAH